MMAPRPPVLTLASSDGMLAAPFAAAPSINLEPGEALALSETQQGHIIAAGRVEIYLVVKSGDELSGRMFLCELGGGEYIAPIVVADDLLVTAVAVETSAIAAIRTDTLAVQAKGSEQQHNAVAASIDGWLSHLSAAVSRMVGPAPLDIVTFAPGEQAKAAGEAALMTRGGVVWLTALGADLSCCGGVPVAGINRRQVAAVAGGIWISPARPCEVHAVGTADILRLSEWQRLLEFTHATLFSLVRRAHDTRQDALREAVQGRMARTTRTVNRAFTRFDAVLGKVAPQAAAEPVGDEPFVAPFVTIASKLGLDFTNRQREQLSRASNVDDAARAVRLRNRQVVLSSDWLQQDLGPLIGFLDDARHPVALIPTDAKRWVMIEAEHARPTPVDATLAARLAPQAHMLYPPFPDRPIGFRQFIGFGWLRNRWDAALAVSMALASALLGLATPMAMQLAFDRFIPGHQTLSLLTLGMGLVLAAFIAAGFRFVFDIASLRLDGRGAGALQAAFMDRLLRLPDSALRMSPGNIASRFVAADQLRRGAYSLMLGSISALLFFVSNIGLMFYYSPAAAGAAIGLFALIAAIAAFCGYHQLDALQRGEEILSDIYGIVFQLVHGITTLRATGSEQRGFARWAMDFAELRSRMYRARTFGTLFETALVAFELLALAVILLILSQLSRDELSTGAFVSFIAAYGAYMGASLQLARSVVAAWNSQPSWGRVAPLLRAAPDVAGSKRDPGVLAGNIDVTNVYFRYGPDAPFALQGVSLSLAPGEHVALVGPSGSGKSTLMRLLLGFEMPASGTVQYDRQDLRYLDIEMVRRQIGGVLQNTALFPGTLYENIMGTHEGTLDQAWEAARQANIDQDINAMPMGMHTIVTEAAAAFSGGQIQRLAVARALVGKPRILLLDEAMSAVDNVTQARLTESLHRLAVTRLVIAHRLTTVKSADRIIVLDRGKVVQTGRYDELMAVKGLFADLVARQLV
ncbi:NHLP bacteriocin export ABC transporter permease/ATPase subunit [Bradyrhizobium sp. B117]|uniref:NHLP bacteriocin export ABC transporter permease/ATPase subunit n=1 Tax=Bradyrhizobium sp. B117 TaxID=3140246 RepID=UPI003183721F